MALCPFDYLPQRAFFRRVSSFFGALLMVYYLAFGIIAPETPLSSQRGPAWEYGSLYALETFEELGRMPTVCVLGDAVSDYQKNLCTKMWLQRAKEMTILLTPLILALFSVLLIKDQLNFFYRSASKKIRFFPPTQIGEVVGRARKRFDPVGYLFCLSDLDVYYPKTKARVRVSVPVAHLKGIRPGDRIAVYNARRRIGMLYAPHVAVVSGVKK